MEYSNTDEVVPNKPSLPVAVQSRPESDLPSREKDLKSSTHSDVSWNRALRDRKRPQEPDGNLQPSPRKQNTMVATAARGPLSPSELGEMDLSDFLDFLDDGDNYFSRFKDSSSSNLDDSGDQGKPEAPSPKQLAEDAPHSASATPQAPKNLRRRRGRNRFALPLLVAHPSGAVTEVMACPDSGSDENIISLELVTSLGLKTERTISGEPRQFTVANGNIVTAVGQVSTSCRFAAGAPSGITNLECIFHVFSTLAVPLIMGVDFLQQTETLSKHRDRLVEQVVPAMQSLRVNSVGRPKRSLVCRLDTYVGCATVDTGSDLDLVSPAFAKARAYKIEPAYEQLEFADCSVGYTSGVIKTSLAVGNVNDLGFHPRGEPIELELHVLEDLNADILVGQDTVDMLDVFNLHSESLIPSMPRLGESDLNIIRHIGRLEKGVSDFLDKVKRNLGGNSSGSSDGVTGRAEAQVDIDQRENARRERERARIAKIPGSDRQREQEPEDMAMQAFEHKKQKGSLTFSTSPAPLDDSTAAAFGFPYDDLNLLDEPSYVRYSDSEFTSLDFSTTVLFPGTSFTPFTCMDPTPMYDPSPFTGEPLIFEGLPSSEDTANIEGTTSTPEIVGAPSTFSYSGYLVPPFQSQYPLNAHANTHSSAGPHYCPVKECPRGEEGKGFKTRDELKHHAQTHHS